MIMESNEIDWLAPLVLISSTQLALWGQARLSGFASAPHVHPYVIAAGLILSLAAVVRLLWFVLEMYKAGETEPTRRLCDSLKVESPRIGAVVLAVALIAASSAAFSSLKGAIPFAVPFWLDPHLAKTETIFGVQPWQASHALLGWATPAIDMLYVTFIPVHVVALCWLLLAKPSVNRAQALVALSLAWLVLGVVAAFVLSSVGPIFYDRVYGGNAFAALNAHLREHAPFTMAYDNLLWSAYVTNGNVLGKGISAMPSMHVALTCWLALTLRKTRVASLAWAYCAVIWIGSVHLGWHYVSDGLVGIAGSILVWDAAGHLIKWRQVPALRRLVPHALR